MAANFVTPYTNLLQQDNGSYQIVVTANGSSGQFYLDGSDDVLTTLQTAPIHWTEIMACGTIAGANDTILIDVNQWPHTFARLRYVSTTPGTGVCTVRLTFKQIGG